MEWYKNNMKKMMKKSNSKKNKRKDSLGNWEIRSVQNSIKHQRLTQSKCNLRSDWLNFNKEYYENLLISN
jgi:hypothetical protein